MKNIKTLILAALTITLFSVVALQPSVNAATDPLEKICADPAASTSVACKQDGKDPLTKSNGTEGIISRATTLVVFATGIISTLMIILGGFTYMKSGGDPQQLKGAKNTIMYACIGLAISVSAYFIVQYVILNLI